MPHGVREMVLEFHDGHFRHLYRYIPQAPQLKLWHPCVSAKLLDALDLTVGEFLGPGVLEDS